MKSDAFVMLKSAVQSPLIIVALIMVPLATQ
jgi:hypothetical protein